MAITINTGPIDSQPPVSPATQTQIESQLFTATGVTGAGTPAEYIVGDILERVVTYTGVSVDSEVWKNLTQNTDLTVVPPGADLAQQSVSGLTDSELRANAVDVFVVNPTEAAGLEPGSNTTTYSETYEALAGDTTNVPAEWSQGDIITREAVVDTSTDPDTITYNYFNETTGLPIESPAVVPTPAELTQVVQQALTDAELRANPVEVFVTNQPQPGPAPTDNQTTVTQYEALTSDTTNTPAQWSAGDVLTYTTTYDYSTTPPTEISTEWFNQTTGEVIDTTLPKVGPAAADITALPDSVVAPSVIRAIGLDRISGTTGTIAEGCTLIDVYVESGYATILGQVFTTGYSFSWTIDNPGEVLGALTIDATNGAVLISTNR